MAVTPNVSKLGCTIHLLDVSVFPKPYLRIAIAGRDVGHATVVSSGWQLQVPLMLRESMPRIHRQNLLWTHWRLTRRSVRTRDLGFMRRCSVDFAEGVQLNVGPAIPGLHNCREILWGGCEMREFGGVLGELRRIRILQRGSTSSHLSLTHLVFCPSAPDTLSCHTMLVLARHDRHDTHTHSRQTRRIKA